MHTQTHTHICWEGYRDEQFHRCTILGEKSCEPLAVNLRWVSRLLKTTIDSESNKRNKRKTKENNIKQYYSYFRPILDKVQMVTSKIYIV